VVSWPAQPSVNQATSSPTGRRSKGAARSSPAFTLIELLVVIVIVAILAGILFPVFSQARAQGYRAACAGNQRQITQANTMYADDHGRYAPAAQDLWELDKRRWFGIRMPNGKFAPREGPLVQYMKDGGQLRHCSAFRPVGGFDSGTGGYVYNAIGVGSLVWDMGFCAEAYHSSQRPGRIRRPSELAMFADGGLDVGPEVVEYGFLEPPPAILRRLSSPYELDPSIHFRHGSSALVAFVDGHVAAKKRVLTVDHSAIYPKANPAARGLGWFGPTETPSAYDPG